MQFGLILRADQPHTLASGFDYLEGDVSRLLNPEIADDQWHLPAPTTPPVRAVHSLIPDSMPITGPNVNLLVLRLHVQKVCERAAQIGAGIVTLSSPDALHVPEDFDAKQAKSQILEFLRTAVPFFARHELMLVAGVNSADESNVMTTLPEVLQYVWQVDHPWFQCLLDVGLVPSGVITMEQMKDAVPWLRHVYVPTPAANIGPVLAELKRSKYQDLISVYLPDAAEPRNSNDVIDSLRSEWESP